MKVKLFIKSFLPPIIIRLFRILKKSSILKFESPLRSIRRIIESSIKSFAIKDGLYICKTTCVDQLVEFFSKIQPITTNYELIRLGGDSDGGYLIPNDLKGISHCFSPGVSGEAYFENDLAKLGIGSFMADYSVESPPIENPLFKFEKKFLGISENKKYMRLNNWVDKNVEISESDLILQMDIEGMEYDVISDVSSDFLKRFRILVIEFHDLHQLFNPFGFKVISDSFKKLQEDFEIVHIHPNNEDRIISLESFCVPPLMEITFLRRDRILSSQQTLSFPHILDRKTVPNKKDIILPDCWYN